MADLDVSSACEGVLLRVRGLERSFGRIKVLRCVDLDVSVGEVVIISGHNGAGKSTLLECLGGVQPVDAGDIIVGRDGVRPGDEDFWSQVFGILDDFAWFPDLTVFDHMRLLRPDLPRDAAFDHLDELGASALLDRKPMTLSSGQRQRCALASAAVRDWSVLLVDEPERHLDRATMPAVAGFLMRLSVRGAVVVASHDPELVGLAGTRQLHLEHSGLVEAP